jgi:hypothetical protein
MLESGCLARQVVVPRDSKIGIALIFKTGKKRVDKSKKLIENRLLQ